MRGVSLGGRSWCGNTSLARHRSMGLWAAPALHVSQELVTKLLALVGGAGLPLVGSGPLDTVVELGPCCT